jgi:aminoglycoside phosphotransferase (APT) family kinase protein
VACPFFCVDAKQHLTLLYNAEPVNALDQSQMFIPDSDAWLAFERLIQKIAPQSALLHIWPLTGGASAHMMALEARLQGGETKKLVVRQPGAAALRANASAAADEFRLLHILKETGLATPKPYLLENAGELFPTPCLVIELVEGQFEFAPANLPHFVRQVAEALASIHRVDARTVDLSFLPRHANQIANRLAEHSSELPEVAKLQAALRAAWPGLEKGREALLHGDFWPGNWLWRDGELVAVVDWEDARLGDPLADVGISRLDMRLIFGVEAMHSFTEHYRTAANTAFTTLPFWDVYAALRAAPNLAEWAAIYPSLGHPEITESTLRAAHAEFTEQALASLAQR